MVIYEVMPDWKRESNLKVENIKKYKSFSIFLINIKYFFDSCRILVACIHSKDKSTK